MDGHTHTTIEFGLEKACVAMRQIEWDVHIENGDVYFSPSS